MSPILAAEVWLGQALLDVGFSGLSNAYIKRGHMKCDEYLPKYPKCAIKQRILRTDHNLQQKTVQYMASISRDMPH